MAGLTLHELKKRNNLEIFLAKAFEGKSFEVVFDKRNTTKKDFVRLDTSSPAFEVLKKYSENPSVENTETLKILVGKKHLLKIKTTDGIEIPVGYLLKSAEFGGKASATVYGKEIWHHKVLQKRLSQATVYGIRPITLHIKTSAGKIYTYNNVTTTKLIGSQTKADFEFFDKSGNSLFTVSHKDGNSPREFLQWSGTKQFKDHPEILQFGKDIKNYLLQTYGLSSEDEFPNRLSIGRKIEDENLKKEAIFGNGEVDFFIQGLCEFTLVDKFEFLLTSKNPILHKTEETRFLPAGYEPVLLAKRSDHQRCSYYIKRCRGMIYPNGGRLFHVFI
jgi:hypothetical protein